MTLVYPSVLSIKIIPMFGKSIVLKKGSKSTLLQIYSLEGLTGL
jgi:hypothetical protein